MKVRVYRNSIRNQWAVVKVGNGNRKVTFYADELTLTDATFHSGLKGTHDVCKSGHVNRHDYVEGKLASFSGCATRLNRVEGTALACHAVLKNYNNEFEARTSIIAPKGRVAVGMMRMRRVEFTNYGMRYVPCQMNICGTEHGC